MCSRYFPRRSWMWTAFAVAVLAAGPVEAQGISGAGIKAAPILGPAPAQDRVRVACVGDSITFGSGVEHRSTNNYPSVLGRLLGPRYEVRNFGVSGATLLRKGDKPYWSQPEFAAVSNYAPQAVILKLGSNDSKPQNWTHAQDFEADLRALVDYFRKAPGRPRLWLCLPVPVYESRWGINEETVAGQIIPILTKVGRELEVPVINLHAALSGKPECFPDKIHPNAAGARIIAETVHAALTGRDP